MAAFVMQALGCDVSALNTVQFSIRPSPPSIAKNPPTKLPTPSISYQTDSPTNFTHGLHKGNHTGYKQFTGTRATAAEISDIYAGLKQSHLTDFDILLSGYAPSADAVEAVGGIARDLKRKAGGKPGSFFWGEVTFFFSLDFVWHDIPKNKRGRA